MRHDKGAHEPKPAATIMLLRDDPEFQVLMVKRHQQIDFASSALVFPGGKLHRADSDPAWVEHCAGWDQFDVVQRSLRIAAIREVFEEAGILMARYPGSDLFEAASDPDVRASVERGEIAFIDVVRELGVHLRLDALSILPVGSRRRSCQSGSTPFSMRSTPPPTRSLPAMGTRPSMPNGSRQAMSCAWPNAASARLSSRLG